MYSRRKLSASAADSKQISNGQIRPTSVYTQLTIYYHISLRQRKGEHGHEWITRIIIRMPGMYPTMWISIDGNWQAMVLIWLCLFPLKCIRLYSLYNASPTKCQVLTACSNFLRNHFRPGYFRQEKKPLKTCFSQIIYGEFCVKHLIVWSEFACVMFL